MCSAKIGTFIAEHVKPKEFNYFMLEMDSFKFENFNDRVVLKVQKVCQKNPNTQKELTSLYHIARLLRTVFIMFGSNHTTMINNNGISRMICFRFFLSDKAKE